MHLLRIPWSLIFSWMMVFPSAFSAEFLAPVSNIDELSSDFNAGSVKITGIHYVNELVPNWSESFVFDSEDEVFFQKKITENRSLAVWRNFKKINIGMEWKKKRISFVQLIFSKENVVTGIYPFIPLAELEEFVDTLKGVKEVTELANFLNLYLLPIQRTKGIRIAESLHIHRMDRLLSDVYDAIVQVQSIDQQKQVADLSSGVVIKIKRKIYVLTGASVIHRAESLKKMIENDPSYMSSSSYQIEFRTGRRVPVKVVGLDLESDIVVLSPVQQHNIPSTLSLLEEPLQEAAPVLYAGFTLPPGMGEKEIPVSWSWVAEKKDSTPFGTILNVKQEGMRGCPVIDLGTGKMIGMVYDDDVKDTLYSIITPQKVQSIIAGKKPNRMGFSIGDICLLQEMAA
jgi:hypothetical protein